MKRLFALLLTLLMLLACASPALADMGMPTIEPYLAVVKDGGAAVKDYNDTAINIPAGTVLYIFDEYDNQFTAYYSADGYYAQFSSADQIEDASDHGVLVYGDKPSQLAALSDTVTPKESDKLTAPLKGKVNSSDGLILRSGPDTIYAVKTLLPDKTAITYEYVVSDGTRDWAYTSYQNTDGWVCLDYVTTAQPLPTQTQTASPATATSLEPATATSTAQTDPEPESQGRGLFATIVIALLLVLILGLVAVILLRSLKKRQLAQAEISDEDRDDELDELESLTEPGDRK